MSRAAQPQSRPRSGRPEDVTDVREEVVELIRGQPADASLDDLVRALAFHRMIERGLADFGEGRLLSHETFKLRAAKWRG